MNLHCVLFMAGHFGGIPLEVFGCILEANLISVSNSLIQKPFLLSLWNGIKLMLLFNQGIKI